MEFERPDEAEKVLNSMDGGQANGQITVTKVLTPGHSHPPYLPPHSPRRFSPAGKELPQVSCGLEILLPCPQSPTQEPLQLQLLSSMSRATRGLPL